MGVLAFLLSAFSAFAQNLQKGTYGYLYCHMSDMGEFTAYALSRDGLNYHDLNDGKAIMNPKELALIEGGQRDAYICRKSDCGKGYLMVTTDMCVAKSKQWFNYGINLLKSDDLIHWTSTTFDFRKGNEIFCDPESPDVITDWSKINRVWAPQIFGILIMCGLMVKREVTLSIILFGVRMRVTNMTVWFTAMQTRLSPS